jgi:hypothetical protein
MEIEEVDLDWDVAQGHRPPPPTAPGLLCGRVNPDVVGRPAEA